MDPKRKSFPRKSRTGCQTCRTRHIKCDESPGECRNCKSAGWKCEGMENIRLFKLGKIKWRKTSPSLTLQRISVKLPAGNVEERRAFAFFQCLTVPGLNGYFESHLWTSLILPMSHSERAVNHAVVALSALHEDLEVRGVPLSQENLTLAHHKFALSQYGRSLAALNERRHSQDPMLREVILTCCLLFVMFELVRGHFDAALFHLRQGLSVMEEARLATQDPLGISTRMNTVERLLSTNLMRFETQSVSYRLPPVFRLSILSESLDEISGFQSLPEAREALDQVLARVVRFLAAAYRLSIGERLLDQQPGLARQQHAIKNQLIKFSQHLQSSPVQASNHRHRKETRGLNLIRLHHITFSCMLETVLCGSDCSIFDNYLINFHEILKLSKRIFDSFLEESTSGTRPSLLLDMGIIPPLFFLCLKCRDFGFRCQALDLLEAWPHREGVWDSRLAVIFVKQQLELEVEAIALSQHLKTPQCVQEVSLKVSTNQKHATLRYQTHEPGHKPQNRQKRLMVIGPYRTHPY